MQQSIENKIFSDFIVFSKYAKHLKHLQRRETWTEVVERNKQMHLTKFPELQQEIEEAYKLVFDKKVLPSLRSAQFGGRPIELNNMRMFNCTYAAITEPAVFSEAMFILLSGAGFGYSVQKHHVAKLPPVRKPLKSRKFLVADNIEGWADAVKVLCKSYFQGKPRPVFDFGDIRPKGAALITSGGKAPGPEPLKIALVKIESVFERKKDGEQLKPIEAHEIICHISNAVLAGGIRRSSCIALFSLDDEEMLYCKSGNWYEIHPEYARANNSVVLLRSRLTKESFVKLMTAIKNSRAGEPGFLLSNDREIGTNPCGEISLKDMQVCNLNPINADSIESQEDLEERVRAATFIGTLQSTYTDFHYVREGWKETSAKDSLLGVSLTGIASNKLKDLDLPKAVKVGLEINAKLSERLGINKTSRLTTIKPEGTSSLVLGTSSGIHAWYAPYYKRRVTLDKNEAVYQYLKDNLPEILEDDQSNPVKRCFVTIPQKAPEGAVTIAGEGAIEFLERIKYYYDNWIKPGHVKGLNTNNISATVNVKEHEWDDVIEWTWNNRDCYTALSFFPYDDHTYTQPPYEPCSREEYEKLAVHLRDIDLTKVIEIEDLTDLMGEAACAGGSCEIK